MRCELEKLIEEYVGRKSLMKELFTGADVDIPPNNRLDEKLEEILISRIEDVFNEDDHRRYYEQETTKIAYGLKLLFDKLVEAGFTEEQAIEILREVK